MIGKTIGCDGVYRALGWTPMGWVFIWGGKDRVKLSKEEDKDGEHLNFDF